MISKELRQKAVFGVIGMVALYALAAVAWFASQSTAWKKAAKAYQREKARYAAECRLIGERAEWDERYENEKSAMPTFAEGRSTETVWIGRLEEIAKRHNVEISQWQGNKVVDADEVFEQPIDAKSWEGALEPLVKFLHELENTDAGMFDVRALAFKQSSKAGYLKGSFTVTCAYMHGDEDERPAAKPVEKVKAEDEGKPAAEKPAPDGKPVEDKTT